MEDRTSVYNFKIYVVLWDRQIGRVYGHSLPTILIRCDLWRSEPENTKIIKVCQSRVDHDQDVESKSVSDFGDP